MLAAEVAPQTARLVRILEQVAGRVVEGVSLDTNIMRTYGFDRAQMLTVISMYGRLLGKTLFSKEECQKFCAVESPLHVLRIRDLVSRA